MYSLPITVPKPAGRRPAIHPTKGFKTCDSELGTFLHVCKLQLHTTENK